MIAPVIKIARNNITPLLHRFSQYMKRGMRDVTYQAAKGITRRVIDITPPASQGSTGRDARLVGEGKISRQMHSVMAPKKLKGRRKVTHVFGRRMRRPVFVPTKEKHPDVAGLYRQFSHARNSGIGVSAKKFPKKFYVDVTKFNAVLRAKKLRVGALAAGWKDAAKALDVPIQQWISRHPGDYGMIKISPDGLRITVENFAPGLPANIRSDLARRIPYAVEYQANAMIRGIRGYKERGAQELGIRGVA